MKKMKKYLEMKGEYIAPRKHLQYQHHVIAALEQTQAM